MTTTEQTETVRDRFSGRLPQEWTTTATPEVITDREEITVFLTIPDAEMAEGTSDAERAGACRSAKAFREDTRDARMAIAREAEHRYEKKVSWGVRVADHSELWTHLAVPVMTRLRQPQRMVLDTLVAAGVAKSRSDALAWCVRLVGQHEGDWLAELRGAMTAVDDIRSQGPTA